MKPLLQFIFGLIVFAVVMALHLFLIALGAVIVIYMALFIIGMFA